MVNRLDEMSTDILNDGREVNVIAKRIPAEVGVGSKIFETVLWLLGIIPGVVFLFMKRNAKSYFLQLEQRIQHNASQIDNYLEQRVIVLQNCSKLLDKAIDLDKSVFENIAKYRSGYRNNTDGDERNEYAGQIDKLSHSVNVAFENYPNIKAHNELEEAMRQNVYLQREITAARDLYNDTINAWNRDIFAWPTKAIVAAKQGYTTRIPFIASRDIKDKAKDVFF